MGSIKSVFLDYLASEQLSTIRWQNDERVLECLTRTSFEPIEPRWTSVPHNESRSSLKGKKPRHLTQFHLDVVTCDIDGHDMTQLQVPWLLKQLSGSVLLCPRSSHSIAIFPSPRWLMAAGELIRWQYDKAEEKSAKAMMLPRTLIFLSSQFCLYFVSSYLATQFLGRILSWPAPFSNVDAQIISLTHSKHSTLNTPELAHSSNIKKVLPAIFYPLMPWWDELPSVSNFLPPPDTKLCEYRPELVIISIIFSLLFFIQEGLHPHFTKENHPVLDLRSADKVYFSNLHCYKV